MKASPRQAGKKQFITASLTPTPSPRPPALVAFKFFGSHDSCGLDGSVFTGLCPPFQRPGTRKASKGRVTPTQVRRNLSRARRTGATWVKPVLGRSQTELTDPSENTLDRLSLYGQKQHRRYAIIEDDSYPPSPLEASPRVQTHVPDGGMVRERRLISEDTVVVNGGLARYSRDEAYVPTVFPNYWERPTNRDDYVRNAFARKCRVAAQVEDCTSPSCFPQHSHVTCESCCTCNACSRSAMRSAQFCEVLGERYCRRCGEVSTRAFSETYQQQKLPPLVGGEKRKTIHVTIPT